MTVHNNRLRCSGYSASFCDKVIAVTGRLLHGHRPASVHFYSYLCKCDTAGRAGGGDLHSVFSGTQEVQGVTALKGNNGSKVTWQDNTRQMLSSF